MRRSLLFAVLVTVSACSTNALHPLGVDARNTSLYGTALDDLWDYRFEPPATPDGRVIRRLGYNDGSGRREIALPAVIGEISGSEPVQLVATQRGELWIAAMRKHDQDATDAPPLVFGTLQSSGVFVDHSDAHFFRTLTPNHSVRLSGRQGFVTVTAWPIGSSTARLFTFSVSGGREIDLPEVVTRLETKVFGPDDFLVIGRVEESVAWHYRNGRFHPLADKSSWQGQVQSLNGDTWLWEHESSGRTDHRQHRYDKGQLVPVDYEIRKEPETGTTFAVTLNALGLIPRGAGKFTWLGLRSVRNPSSYAVEVTVIARQFDGSSLEESDTAISDTMECKNEKSAECLDMQLRHHRTLDDGTILLESAGDRQHPAKYFYLSPDEVP